MTSKIVMKEQIRAEILKILSGYCFRLRRNEVPKIYIICPWIYDVDLIIDDDVKELDIWFEWIYGIKSINLPYALLLLRLDLGAEISIVTRPPEDNSYKAQGRTDEIRNLLDFLDEIGCQILTNDKIHTKLILSNDLALIGSMNLSKTALYDKGQEEIGTSMDDLSNLSILERYADDLIRSSNPYGYTCPTVQGMMRYPYPVGEITRGWLYDCIVHHYYGQHFHRDTRRMGFDSFDEYLTMILLRNEIHSRQALHYTVVKGAAKNLDAFYFKVIWEYLNPTHEIMKEDVKESDRLSLLWNELGYRGTYEIKKAIDFIDNKFARERVPIIPLRVDALPLTV